MIAPITGMLKKRVIVDIGTGVAIGSCVAAYWWYGVHQNMVKTRENYYASLAAQKKAEDDA